MHELALAEEVARIAGEVQREHGPGRVQRVVLRIGALQHVAVDALEAGFRAVTEGGELEGAALEVEAVRARVRCDGCDQTTITSEPLYVCPHCGAGDLEALEGNELEVATIEIEPAEDAPE